MDNSSRQLVAALRRRGRVEGRVVFVGRGFPNLDSSFAGAYYPGSEDEDLGDRRGEVGGEV